MKYVTFTQHTYCMQHDDDEEECEKDPHATNTKITAQFALNN